MYRFVVELGDRRCVRVGREGDRFKANRGGRVSGYLHYIELATDERVEVVIDIIIAGKVDIDVIVVACGGVRRVHAGDVVVVDEDWCICRFDWGECEWVLEVGAR